MSASTNQIPVEVSARSEELRRLIRHHNQLYYQEARTEISDMEFDALVRELEELESRYPVLLTPDSPTQQVWGAPLEGFTTVSHRVPMLSIGNTYNEQEVLKFDQDVHKLLLGDAVNYVVELKMDGVAMSLTYRDGVFIGAATRGDGRSGDDVTQNVRTIRTLPKQLKGNHQGEVEMRGEVYMTRSELERLNTARVEAGEEPYRNPRNTTAGTLKLLDPNLVAARNLQIAVYDLLPVDGPRPDTHMQILETLADWDLPVNSHYRYCPGIQEVLAACEEWREKRHTLDYETDGLVVKVNRLDQRERLGATSKAPRWVIAYKFPAEVARTRLLGISVQVGKSGVLTPVAELEPVPLAGTIVKRSTLHNFEELRRKELRVGDLVEVQKAGEIIPQVLRYVPEARPSDALPFEEPTACPECHGPVQQDPDGVFVRCINFSCPAQVRGRLAHFASRGAMDIDGLGPAIIDQLVNTGLVQTPADLFHLDAPTLEKLERMGKKSAENLVSALEACKQRPLSRLLFGLGIQHVGTSTASALARRYALDELFVVTPEELSQVEDIGPVVSQSIAAFFASPENHTLLDSLRANGLNVEKEAAPAIVGNSPISGKTFVVTGTLERYGRDEIHEVILRAGGKTASSVSKKTDFLVAGDKAGSKLDKARELGVAVLTEQEFELLMEGNA